MLSATARTALLLTLTALAPFAQAAPKQQPTVAILYFDYQGKTEQMELLRKGLAQMLISDLSGNDGYQIVERDRLQDLMEELKLNQSSKIDKSTANRLGKLLGAQYMVLGGYFDLMGMLRVDARVVEVETGKVIRSIGHQSKPEGFLELEKNIAEALQVTLQKRLEKRAKRPRAKRAQRRRPKRPKKLSVKTAVRYSKALNAMDKGDKATAKAEMKKVVKAQPDFEIALLDLKNLVQ